MLTASTNRNNYPMKERSSLREFSVKLVKHRSLHFVTSRASKIDHISGIKTILSGISYCMKVQSVRDQPKIDQVPGMTIYPMTM